MRPQHVLLITLTVLLPISAIAQAVESSENEMWECPGPDGTSLYTNKERPGCQPKELRPLSIVPSIPDPGLYPCPGMQPSIAMTIHIERKHSHTIRLWEQCET